MIKTLFSLTRAATVGLCLSFSASAFATDTFTFDSESDTHNMLMFQLSHQGFSRSIGFFQNFEGTLELDMGNLENSTVEVDIDLTSLDLAASEEWKKHTTNYFFKGGKIPEITFKSTRVEDLGNNRLAVTGDLTLMGITKSLTMDTTLNKVGDFMGKSIKAGFSATASLSRKDFGVVAIPSIGDEVTITIEIEATKQEQE